MSLNNTPMIRGKCEFDHDILTVFRAYSDFEQRVSCDSNLESCKFSAQYGSNFIKISEKFKTLPKLMHLNLFYNYEKDDSILGVYFSAEMEPDAHKMFAGFKVSKSPITNKTVLRLLFDADFGANIAQSVQEKTIRSQVDGLLILKDKIGEWAQKNA